MADGIEGSAATPEELQASALRPRAVQAGTERVEEHSLPDQVAMSKHLAQQSAGKAGNNPVQFPRFRMTHGRP